MTTQRERLMSRKLKTRVVTLPAEEDGQDDERVTVRALRPGQFDDLVKEHPPTRPERDAGFAWHLDTFRPALLAACVVPPPGEEDTALSAEDWASAWSDGWMNAGEIILIYDTCVAVNDRHPQASVKKD